MSLQLSDIIKIIMEFLLACVTAPLDWVGLMQTQKQVDLQVRSGVNSLTESSRAAINGQVVAVCVLIMR